jgi:hypothetical protein
MDPAQPAWQQVIWPVRAHAPHDAGMPNTVSTLVAGSNPWPEPGQSSDASYGCTGGSPWGSQSPGRRIRGAEILPR